MKLYNRYDVEMKKIKNIILSLILVTVILSLSMLDAFAETYSISLSGDSSAKPGQTITLTVSIKGCRGGTVSLVGQNCTLNKTTIMIDGSETVKVTVGNSGTAKITATSNDATPNDSFSIAEARGEKIITIKSATTPTKPTTPTTPSKPTVTKSSDNKLSSLTVSEGTLTPAFKADVTEYNVNVGATVSKITLSAKTNHDKAKVSGTGEKTLNVGKNTFEIKCTAENGSVKTYKVHVHVDETPLVFTTYKDQRLGVVRNTAGLGIPKTFEKTTITLDGQSVEAYQSNQFNKTIVYLQTDAGEKNFYIYEEGNGIVSIFKPVSICGVNVYVYDIAESDIVRDNMTYQSVNIGGVEMNGWVFINPRYENYSLIKVMNEFGNEVMYSYEKTEGTLQLYTEYVEEETPEEESDISTLEYILMGTTGFFALTTLIAFVSHLRFKKKSIAAIKDYYQRRNQE